MPLRLLGQLNFNHLYYFWVVAREGSVTRATKVLHLAQPTISSQLRTLERTLGAALADSVILTMRDGTRKASGAVHHAVGHPQRPLSEEALRNKFLDALEYGGYIGDAPAFYARVNGMEALAAADFMECGS
ncbi:MAG: LysR family transcriptional regulator [Opitutaceae bacterium]